MQQRQQFAHASATYVDRLTEPQLRALVRIAECGLGSGVDGIDDHVVNEVWKELSPDFCGVWRSFEQEPSTLKLVSHCANGQVPGYAVQDVLPRSQAQYMSFSDSAVVVSDLASERRFAPARLLTDLGLVSGVTVPLIGSSRCHGIIDVYWNQSQPLFNGELPFLSLASKSLSGALDYTLNAERIAAESAQAQVLIEIGKVVGSSLQIGSVYARFAELAGCLIPFDRISLSLIDEATGKSRTAYNSGKESDLVDQGQEHDLRDTIAGEVARLRRPVVIDSRNHLEFATRLSRYRTYADAGLVSTLSVPIVWHDRVIAVLTMRSLQQNAYCEQHMVLASRVAALIAGAVANAEMHRALDRLATERLRLAEIGRAVNSAPDQRTAFMRLANGVGQLMPVDRIALATLGDQGRRLRRRFVSGLPIAGWGEDTIVLVYESVARKALELGHPVVFHPEEQNPDSSYLNGAGEIHRSAGVQSVMCVPLMYGGKQEGVLWVCSRKSYAYGEHELSLADRVASLVSAFLAALKIDERNALIQHHLDLASALLRPRDPAMTRVQFVREMEEEIIAAAFCDLVVYCERDKGSMDLTVRYAGGLSSHLVPVGERAATVEARRGTVAPLPRLEQMLASAGMQSSVWIPVNGEDGVIGALGAFAYRPLAIGYRIHRSLLLLADSLSRSFGDTSRIAAQIAPSSVNGYSDDNRSGWAPPIVSDSRVAKVIVVDAHPACRGTIKVRLAGRPFNIVGECRSIEDVLEPSDGECDLVIWGLHSQDGSEQLRHAARFSHLHRTLILADRLSVDGLREVLRAGISGYLPRQTPPQALERALLTLMEGGTVIDPTLLSIFFTKVPAEALGLTDTETDLLHGLSERDRLILREVAQGKSNVAIARDLNLAVGSVKNRLVEIYRLIGAADRVEATAFTIRAGLLK